MNQLLLPEFPEQSVFAPDPLTFDLFKGTRSAAIRAGREELHRGDHDSAERLQAVPVCTGSGVAGRGSEVGEVVVR